MTISSRNRGLLRLIVLVTVAANLASLIAPSTLSAQSYPNKMIKLVLPLPAGGPMDALARIIAPALSSQLKQTIIVENRPGGGATIGAKAVATAPSDGYTLLFASATHTLGPALLKNPGYDPIKDFAPIAQVGTGSWVLVVAPSVPTKSVAELVAHAKANPGTLNWGFGRNAGPH